MNVRLIASVLAAFFAANALSSEPTKSLLYIGAYTQGKDGAKGITVCDFDSATGKISNPRLAAEMRNPSFLAIHPNKSVLYAVGETADMGGKREGAVAAFNINPENGLLQSINYVSSRGPGPCHLSIDPSAKT